MQRYLSGIGRKHLGVWLGSLLWIPVLAAAQETVPVTVIIQFEQPAVEAFGGSGGGNLAASTISAAGVSSRTIFDRVVLPRIESRSERQTREEELTQRFPQRPRTFGGTLRYEQVDFDREASGLDGNIYATNLQMAWDIENVSLGVLVPYEFLDLRRFAANLVGAILYGQYNLELNSTFTLGVTANGNYMYTGINNDFLDVNTYGGGLGLSLTIDHEVYVVGGAFSYQYNQDDSDTENDYQHLVKLGVNAGIRIGQTHVVNLFGTWNYDITSYEQTANVTDDNYFDLGITASWSITQTWNLNGGYKHVLGLKGFESNQFFVGTLVRF
jgi:hypothetical protein